MGEFLDLAAEFSLDGIELRFLNDSLDVGAEMEKYLASPENARAFAAAARAIPVIDTSFHLCAADGEAMAGLQAAARAADALGARWLRVFDGPVEWKALDDGHGTKARENFAAWRRWRDDNGVRAEMAVETHGACSSTLVLERLFAAIGGHLPVVWDVHHTQLVAGESFAETWARIGADVVHVHVKDSVDKPSPGHAYTLTLPGEGRFDCPAFLEFLRGKNYDGFVSLEWERKWHPYLPPLRDALRAMRAAGWMQNAGNNEKTKH